MNIQKFPCAYIMEDGARCSYGEWDQEDSATETPLHWWQTWVVIFLFLSLFFV
jgi:hypothetical protein